MIHMLLTLIWWGFGLGVGFTLGRWVVLAVGEFIVSLYLETLAPIATTKLPEPFDAGLRTTIRSLVAIDRAAPR